MVIDAPAADRSDMALTLAPLADATVMVVAADSTGAAAPAALREEIDAAGGRVAGLVMNRSTWSPPKLLRRFFS